MQTSRYLNYAIFLPSPHVIVSLPLFWDFLHVHRSSSTTSTRMCWSWLVRNIIFLLSHVVTKQCDIAEQSVISTSDACTYLMHICRRPSHEERRQLTSRKDCHRAVAGLLHLQGRSFWDGTYNLSLMQHLHSCKNNCDVFYGRDEELVRLKEYITGPSTKVGRLNLLGTKKQVCKCLFLRGKAYSSLPMQFNISWVALFYLLPQGIRKNCWSFVDSWGF